MDYLNIEYTTDQVSSCPQHFGYGARRRTATFLLVSFSAFLIIYAFSTKSPSPQESAECSSATNPPRQLRPASPSRSMEHEAAPRAAIDGSLRGFVLAWNEPRGFLLLRCDKKAQKGTHYQLPGGHVEPAADLQVTQAAEGARGQVSPSPTSRTSAAASVKTASREDLARTAAARELWEETGLDVRGNTQQLVSLLDFGVGPLKNNRYYFFLDLTDTLMKQALESALARGLESASSTPHPRVTAEVSPHAGDFRHAEAAPRGEYSRSPSQRLTQTPSRHARGGSDTHTPQRIIMLEETAKQTSGGGSGGEGSAGTYAPVKLPIGTAEHSGFRFEADPQAAATLVEKHSGGCSSSALLLFRRMVAKTASNVLAAKGIPVTFK